MTRFTVSSLLLSGCFLASLPSQALGIYSWSGNATDNATTTVSTPHKPLTDPLTLLSRRAEAAVFSQVLTSFLGLLASGKVMTFVAPFAVKFLVMPLIAVVKSVAKGLMLVGVFGWLVSAIIPTFLAYMGLAGPALLMARAMGPVNNYLPASVGQILSQSVGGLFNRGLDVFDMNNEECKMLLACKSGEFLIKNYPDMTRTVTRSRYGSWFNGTSQFAASDRFLTLAFKAMEGRAQCDRDLAVCPGLSSLENYFTRMTRGESLLSMVTMTTSTTTTTTTTTPPPVYSSTASPGNTLLIGALQSMLTNYYNYHTNSGPGSNDLS